MNTSEIVKIYAETLKSAEDRVEYEVSVGTKETISFTAEELLVLLNENKGTFFEIRKI